MSHTPGAWTIADSDPILIQGGKYTVCTLPAPRANEYAFANARLIVAAPELLEALHHMHFCAHCAEGSWEDCPGGREALAAIAKAEGK